MKSSPMVALFVVLVIASAAPAQAVEPSEKSFLWKATSGDRTVTLLGSIHFMKADAYPLSPAIEEAWQAAGIVVFETDIEQVGKAAVAMLEAGTLEGDDKLEDVLPKELFDDLSRRLDDLGLGIDMYRKMRPWLVGMGLTSFELMRAGYLGSEGIDAHFHERSKAAGKPQRGLETIEAQISLFADMPIQESIDFLRYTLADLDTVIPLVDEIVAAWKVGNAARIEELLVDGFEEHEALYDRLVTQRNPQWLPQIEGLLSGEVDAMVVVGSLHLVGEQGLVELLRANGYQVEQL